MFFYRLVVRLFCYLTDRLPSLEQHTLMRLLSVAVSNQVSQSDLLRAFANDFGMSRSARISRTADLLDQGVSLADALEQAPGLLSLRDLVAVRFGTEMGTLRASLKAATREVSAATEDAVQRVTDSLVYIGALALISSLMLVFLMIKIVPTLYLIFMDFEQPIPEPLALLVEISARLWSVWFVFVLGFLIIGVYVVSGQLSRDIRGGWIGRLLMPAGADGTLTVLDQLAIARRAGRPLEPAISTLARYHPNMRMRRKLLYVRNELELGAPIWNAFVTAKIVSQAEGNALRAADDVGNTAWVIDQLAAKRRSCQASRIQVFAQVLFPFLIFCMALVVGFIALSLLASILTFPANFA